MTFETIGNDKPLSCEEFEKHVQKDIDEVKKKKSNPKNGNNYSEWVYRGQSNSDWGLRTSLERFTERELGNSDQPLAIVKYFQKLFSAITAINSLTENRFPQFMPPDAPDKTHFSDSTKWYPILGLLYYARHHGFPTPLLDWSKSYYVAAFFAFRDAERDKNVAIYSFQEWSGNLRGGFVGSPIISELGSYVETHARHYKQQSVYTVCGLEHKEKGFFSKHEDALERGGKKNHNMKKFILKADEKEKVLKKLFMMNINDYTLFGSEESLLRMLAFKEFHELS